MVTISIQPYAARKLWLLAVTLLCLSTLSSFANSLYVDVPSTPYDRQMTRIRPVLVTKSSGQGQDLSLAVVNHWIQNLRAIPYGYSVEWKTPQEVETGAAADCKGKAVALYEMMHARGAEDLRLVIGKKSIMSRKTHAWLEWTTTGHTYLLDPTINWRACSAERLGGSSYIPLYAYAGNRKYRATLGTPAGLFAKNQFFTGRRVASSM